MKSIRKYLLIIAAALLAVTLSACSKVTAEEAINKSTEASKNLKNTEFVSSNVSEIVIGDQTQKIENKVSGSLILEPFTMHATTEIKTQNKSQTLEMYIKDNVAYAKATGQDTWVKSSNNNITAQFENLKKLANSSGGQVNASAFNNVEFKNVTIKFVVSKDFMPISNETIMEIATKNATKPTTMKITQNTSYSKINKVDSINIPEEAKNAKEIGRS